MPNIIDIPTSFNRLEGFPLDQSSVFNSYSQAEQYASLDVTSYAGQVIFVTETNQAYIITSSKSLLSLNLEASNSYLFWSNLNSFPTFTFTLFNDSNEPVPEPYENKLFLKQISKNSTKVNLLRLSKTTLESFTCINQSSIGGSLNVSGYTNLTKIKCNNVGLTTVSVKGCSSLTEVQFQSNQLQSIDVSDLTNCTYFHCAFNNLPVSQVDNILITLDDINAQASNSFGYKYCGLWGGTNAPPSVVGLQAKVRLRDKGWIVQHNN